jgi:hypothetical protein
MMIDGKTLVNSIGIGLTMLGVYMVYINSPINHTVIDGGNASTDWTAIERKAKLRNTLLKAGVYLVLAGSAAQLASNFVPSGSSAAA